jgi:hypothetical protein
MIQRPCYQLGVCSSLELKARDVDTVVRVAQVLRRRVSPGSDDDANERTWYTVPPPLFRRTKGISSSLSRGRFISFHGFCAKEGQLRGEGVESPDGPDFDR